MVLHVPTGVQYESCGVFDLRCWECNMPERFSASDMVYLTKVPAIIEEALEMNGCESTNENFDLMTTAAAGLLEGHSLQMLSGNIEEKEVVDENWHHGMLDCLGSSLLAMVTTAYEKATRKMRDAFIYQVEQNTAKNRHPRDGEEERAVPGDILAETIFKLIDATVQLSSKAPFEEK